VLSVSVTACYSPDEDDYEPSGDDERGGEPPEIDAAVIPTEPAITTRQLCKLFSNRHMSDPTANDVQHRANIWGADLGIPVVHDDRLFIMFGDTIGYQGIWSLPESHPDSIGYALDPAADVAERPDLLCNRLGMVTLSANNSVGPRVDPMIEADFAGVAMTAPAGKRLSDFIKNPSGGNGGPTYGHLPGDFEVPSGAFAHGDSIYVFYTTVKGPGQIEMQGSYLARWKNPSPTSVPNFQILYEVDHRRDDTGPLGGQFINIAAEVVGDYVYLFGTGEFRKSAISVARKRLDALATPGGFEELGVIVTTPGYGETSVRYLAAANKWMLLAEELQPGANRIVASFAADPAGPWSTPLVVHDMGDPAFQAQYCCAAENACEGEQFFNCNRTGFYGTYLFPTAKVDGTAITVTYTMSSFSPYNVALFEATFTAPP
jgi:hypothetical protein